MTRNRHVNLEQAFINLFTRLGEIEHFAWDVWRYFHRIEHPTHNPLKHLIRSHSVDLIGKGMRQEEAKRWLQEFILFIAWFRASLGTRLNFEEENLLKRANVALLPLREVLQELVYRYFPPSIQSHGAMIARIKNDPLLQRTIPEMIISDLPSERLFKKVKNKTYLGLVNTAQKHVLRQLPLQLTSQLVTTNLPLQNRNLRRQYQNSLPTVPWHKIRELKSIYIDWDHVAGVFRERVHETDKTQLQQWLENWFLIEIKNGSYRTVPQKIRYLPSPELLRLFGELELLDISILPNDDVFVRMKLSDDDFLYLHHAMMAVNLRSVTHFAKRWMFRYLGWLFFVAALHYYCTEVRTAGKTLDEEIAQLEFYGAEASQDPYIDNASQNPYYHLFEEELIGVYLATAFISIITALRQVPVAAADDKTSRIEFYYQQPMLTSFTLLNAAKSADMQSLFKQFHDKPNKN